MGTGSAAKVNPGHAAAAQLTAARRDMEAARAALGGGLSGDPYAAERALRRAADCLCDCGPLLRMADHDGRAVLREAALDLATELVRLEALLAQAMSFFSGWTDRLGAMQAGYTAAGSPARAAAVACVRLEA